MPRTNFVTIINRPGVARAVSRVMCHLSPVTCHLSHVKKNIFIYLKKKKIIPSQKLDKVVELVGGGSVINGAYPV